VPLKIYQSSASAGTGKEFRGFAADVVSGTYVSTVWVVLFLVPLWPIASFTIRNEGTKYSGGLPPLIWTFGTSYKILHKIYREKNIGQIIRSFVLGN